MPLCENVNDFDIGQNDASVPQPQRAAETTTGIVDAKKTDQPIQVDEPKSAKKEIGAAAKTADEKVKEDPKKTEADAAKKKADEDAAKKATEDAPAMKAAENAAKKAAEDAPKRKDVSEAK